MGNTKYHFLSWEGEKGGEWLNEDFFDILDDDGGHKTTTIEESCNTRKSRDKRTRAHTVGLFVGVKPLELSAFSTRCMDANPYPRFHLENN